jgi:NADH dehydrogenase
MHSTLIVAGGGFAGLWAALAAKRELQQHTGIEVRLVSNDPYLTMRPRLYEADPKSLRVPLAATLDTVGVGLTMAQIEDISVADQHLVTDTGHIPFDRLVLATGSQLRQLPVPGAEHCLSADDYEGAVELDRRLQDYAADENTRRIVIIGAGFTGIELATELRTRLADLDQSVADATTITLIDCASEVGPELGANPRPVIEDALREARVEVLLDTSVERIERDHLTLNTGEVIDTSMVVNCTGMQASPLTGRLNLPLDSMDRLAVDEVLRVRGASSVFSAGDTAHARTDDAGHETLMSCQHALATGRYAGHNAARDLLGRSLTPYRQERYLTCLDLGASGAVVTQGWDRQVIMTGEDAGNMKREINTRWIYPPQGTAEEILAQAALPEE